MTYKETLNWMFSQLPMYQQKGPSAYNAKLSTSYALAEHLNHPQKKFKSIHVAGTNGKGSSSHMLASILQEAGYKVGLYTSPHLKDFRERIKINGVSISEEAVSAFINENKSYLETNRLSFFEMTVGMAFDYFAKQEVDIAIIEVGLGGRLDSTNIILPEISLITNIGLDHQDLLGNTLEKIAYEKAGIIKEGVPVVVSEYQEEVASVFKEITSEKKTTLTFASEKEYRKYKLPLQGNYQEKNIKGVLEVISQLSSFNIQESDIIKGISNVIKNTGLLGRWQILAKRPLTICDTAHNKEGLSLVLSQVGQQEFRELHMVIGFVKEKDLDGILPLFPKKAIYYFCKPGVPRGLDVEILKEKAALYNLLGESFSSAKQAYEAAKQRADPEDLIFIGGSTFTVSDVL